MQGVFLPTHDAEFKRVDMLEESKRNTDGFGSTGDGSKIVQCEVQRLFQSQRPYKTFDIQVIWALMCEWKET